MTGEVERFRKVREELNSISPSFCAAKWLQTTILLQTGKTHSCHHPWAHTIDLEEIKNDPSALHNTKYKKELQSQMVNGIRPKECQFCWNIEDLPGDHISDRTIKSSELWSYPHLHEIKFKAKTPETTKINPTYVEVSFSNLCNFKCSYCSPEQSSQWLTESMKFGPYPTKHGFNGIDELIKSNRLPISIKEYNPYVEAFWKWWPELYETLQVFRITGGEPLMSPDTFKVLDYINEYPNRQLEFNINTNACVSDDLIDKFISKMKKITVDEKKIGVTNIFTSVDAWGPQAEYIRHGMNYDQWINNIDKMLTQLPNTSVVIMCTSNIFSLFSMKDLLEDVYALKKKHYTESRKVPVLIDISILRFPTHQRADIITEDYWHFLDDAFNYMKDHEEGNIANNIPHYRGFFDFEIAKLERLIEFIKNGAQNEDTALDISLQRRDFYAFIEEHDRRRNTKMLSIFPKLRKFYNLCKDEYKKTE